MKHWKQSLFKVIGQRTRRVAVYEPVQHVEAPVHCGKEDEAAMVSQREVERAVRIAAQDFEKGRTERVQWGQVDHVVERARREAVGSEALGTRAPRSNLFGWCL